MSDLFQLLQHRMEMAIESAVHQRQLEIIRMKKRFDACSPEKKITSRERNVAEVRLRLEHAMQQFMLRREPLLPECRKKLMSSMQSRIIGCRSALERDSARLAALNPKAVLKRGYALVNDGQGRAITSASIASQMGRMSVVFEDGAVWVIPDGKDRKHGSKKETDV